jgi:hypothetical protein
MSNSPKYNLVPTGETEVTITLTPQTNTYFTKGSDTTKLQTFTIGQVGVKGSKQKFTLHTDHEYASAMIEVQYVSPHPSKTDWNPPSYCHIYFKPNGTDWIWSGESIVGDNPSVLVAGEGLHKTADIELQVPTQANPAQGGNQYQCLESSIVFLLDKKENGNMVFRGNEPLAPGASDQLVDFNTLHNTLKQKYFRQTGKMDFPEKGKYVLRDIAFLGPGEDSMMLRELKSFGGSKISQLDNQAWYPASPASVLGSSGVLGQMSNWNVEPSIK